MGIILLPVLLVASVVWFWCLIVLIRRVTKKEKQFVIGALISPIFSILAYCIVLNMWAKNDEVWMLQPFIDTTNALIILPGILGVALIKSIEKPGSWVVVSVAICCSVVLSGLLLVVFPSLMDPSVFLNIKITH